MLSDTHCHIHESGYPRDIGDVMNRAHHAGVFKMICVGTSEQSSREAIAFSAHHEHVFASVGVHPHDTKDGWSEIAGLLSRQFVHIHSENGFAPGLTSASAAGQSRAADVSLNEHTQIDSSIQTSKVVAVGEIGLDYFYTHSPREVQIKALEEQIQLALDHNLPIIFHVRDAFEDFWPIFDNFSGIKGELHSFTDVVATLEQALGRNLFIGVNGISTFTKDEAQQAMFDSIPLENMLFETDAPFLTPVPHRGTVNEPAFVRNVAEYHAARRGVELEHLARATSANASLLFSI